MALILGLLLLSGCASRPVRSTPAPEAVATAVPTATSQPTAMSAPTTSPAPTTAPSPTPAGPATVVPTQLAGANLPKPILFIDLRQQLVRLAPDGTRTEITSEPGNLLDFDISSDGTTLAYLVFQSNRMLLVQHDLQGAARSERVSGILRAPLFDPDGQQILFAVDAPGAKAGTATLSTGVWSIPIAGGDPTQLVKGIAPETIDGQVMPGLLYAPLLWSPDGKQLLLLTAPDFGPDLPAGDIGAVGLAVYTRTDETLRELIPPGGNPRLCLSPSWSADSTAIYCSAPYSIGEETPPLFRIDLASGEQQDVLPREGLEGATIAVLGASDGPRGITILAQYRKSDTTANAVFERFVDDPSRRTVIVPLTVLPDPGSAVVWANDGSGALFSTGERPQLYWQPYDGPVRALADGPVGRVRWER